MPLALQLLDGVAHGARLLRRGAPRLPPQALVDLDLSTPDRAEVGRLYLMLEGQVAILSSGLLDADGTRALAELEDLESDLHRHVHLENHVLGPRAAA